MDKEKYVCKVCGKAFRSEYGLKNHMRVDHAGRYYGVRVILPVLLLVVIITLIILTIRLPALEQQTTTTTVTTQQSKITISKPNLQRASDFSLPVYDPSSSLERYIGLSDFSGKPVFLEFFQPNCGHCINMIPTIEELSRRYGDRMVFLVISTPLKEQLKSVIEKYGLTQTILLDVNYEVFDKYGVEGTPTFIILDSSHNIVQKIVGESSIEILAKAIEGTIS
ncbi:MAG: redoxin domain-containing protein [Nitrososphaerota archaeon]